MLHENISLDTKPDLRSRGKVVQGADCRRTGNTLRRLRLAEERKHHYQYLIHYTLNEHGQLCTDVTRSLNKQKRWELVEELKEDLNNNTEEDNINKDSAQVITNVHHFRRPTIRWTEEKLKNRLLRANEANDTDQEDNTNDNTANNEPIVHNHERRKLRMGRKGFMGAKRPEQATEQQEVTICKTKEIYEVLKLPKAGVYPLNRVTCHCHYCTTPRKNKGKNKENAITKKFDLLN